MHILKLGSFITFLISSILFTTNAQSQNKVVVIPMAGDDVNISEGFTFFERDIINFTTSDVTVGSLSLPAGSYIINASITVNNNASEVTRVYCSLRLNDTIIDDLFDSMPLAPNFQAGDREIISLTGGGVLGSAGTASMVCNTNGEDSDEGNYLSPSITAIKVASVTSQVMPSSSAISTTQKNQTDTDSP